MKQLPHKARVFFSALFSLKTTSAVVLWLAVLTVWGTFYEMRSGLYAGQQRFFHSWIVFAWGVAPLPGVRLAVAILFVQCAAAIAKRFKIEWRSIGFLLIHTGILLLIAAMAFISFTSEEATLTLAQGEHSTVATGEVKNLELPLKLTLLEFQKKDYAGTNMAKGFESRVRIEAQGLSREAVISMNRPLRYGSFTFFQQSYALQGDSYSSTLAVVKNPGKILPFWASIIIALGLLYHFSLKLFASMRKGFHENKS